MQPNGTRRRLEELKDACRREGIPITVQRSVIFEALVARSDHPTAEQILDDVRQRLPGLSRTTVYRVLDTLTKMGLAVRTCSPGAATRFDPTTERHHHLVCLECGRIDDLRDPALDALPFPAARRLGFLLSDYSVHFRGICESCRGGKGTASKTAAPGARNGRVGAVKRAGRGEKTARARRGGRANVTP